MAVVTLEFPALVRCGQDRVYEISPLFTGNPTGSNKRFEKALRQLTKYICEIFHDFYTRRANMDSLLWYRFNPEVKVKKMDLEFMSGQKLVCGAFTVARFDLDGETYVCLPGFDNHFFVAEKNEGGKIDLRLQVEDVIKHLLREKRKYKGGQVKAEDYMSAKDEFLTIVEECVYVSGNKIPFDTDLSELFACLFGEKTTFHGFEEIEKVGKDINYLYPDELCRASYRDELVERVRKTLYQKDIVPIVLVGPKGAGRTTVLHEAVYRHLAGSKRSHFARLEKVWYIDPIRVVSGMAVVGMWQKRFESIIQYAMGRLKTRHKINKRDSLFFDNLVALLRVGKSAQNSMTLSDVLRPYLEERKLRVIGEATPEEWKVVQELDRRFADLFQVIRVPEPPRPDGIKMVMKQRAGLEYRSSFRIANQAVHCLFTLQRTFMRHKALPGGVVDMLKQMASKYKTKPVDRDAVHEEFKAVSRLNNRIFDRSVFFEEGEVREGLERYLVGQKEALACLVDTVHALKAGLNDPEKPVGAFLFIGPTGVGKTQAAKVLARYLFTDEECLVRFDMNEYIDAGAVNRLIGDLRHTEGQLTGKVRYRPFCVLLLDEIEKAHPNVHDLLLQVLGEGRLTDALGRTVDFTNTIIIMTSNIGAAAAGKEIGLLKTEATEAGTYRTSVQEFFRPEFLNRVDRVVVFDRLKLEEVIQIARLQIGELLQRDGFVRRTTILNVSRRALEKVAARGFDSELGGRALKRTIEKELTSLSAGQMITVPAEHPILFEIYLHRGKLLPRVTPLEEVRPRELKLIPEQVAKDKSLSAFRKLYEFVRRFEAEIGAFRETLPESDGVMGAESGAFSRSLAAQSLKEAAHYYERELEDTLWALETGGSGSRKYHVSDRVSCRPSYSLCSWYGCGRIYKQFSSGLALREHLYEVYVEARAIVEKSQAAFLGTYLELSYLYFQFKALLEDRIETVVLHIRSCVEDLGEREVQHLSGEYTKVWRNGVFVEIFRHEVRPNEQWIVLSGPGLRDFFKNELGIHMFFRPFTTPVPVQVRVVSVPSGCDPADFTRRQASLLEEWIEALECGTATLDDAPFDFGRVVRLYCLPYGNLGNDTITDLRTGTITRADMSLHDWLILFSEAFSDGDRALDGGG